MSDEKLLTKEIAEQFLADEDSVDLSEFTAIEDDAAEVLGQSGSDLEFGSFDQLTADCAVALGLSASEYSELTFEKISSLDDDAAIALCQYKGTLDIRDYTPSTSPASFALAESMGRASSISSACDKSLSLAARISLEELDLSGLQNIDACQAAALRPYKGTLFLNGIKSVDHETALTLSSLPSEIEMAELDLTHNPDIVILASKIGRLSELTDLPASQAGTLADLNSHLDLSGLKQITQEAGEMGTGIDSFG